MVRKMKKINFKKLFIIIIGTIFIGSIFSLFLMNQMRDYQNLNQPFLSPPGILFPIVWTILFILMGISLYIVSESYSNEKNKAYCIYIIQLLVNSLWTLIFFGMKMYLLSFIWILLLIVLVIIMIIRFLRINKIAGLLQIPYLLWLVFASYLSLSVYILN